MGNEERGVNKLAMKDTDEQGRGKPSKDRPWCWQQKSALAMITETFSESNQAASARSVYLALSELSSDKRSDTFTASKALVAHKAGVSVKTVEKLLNGFEQLGLVRIDRNVVGGLKVANTYTLLSMRHCDASMRNGGQSSVSDRIKESGKILKTHNTRNGNSALWKEHTDKNTHAARDSVCSLGRLTEDWRDVLEHYHDALVVQKGWFCVNKLTRNLKEIFDTATPDDLHAMIDAAANATPNEWPRKRKFVNLYWHAKPKKRGRSRSMPIAQRNKIINKLNDTKVKIMRTFPDGKYEPWATEQLEKIQHQLERL